MNNRKKAYISICLVFFITNKCFICMNYLYTDTQSGFAKRNDFLTDMPNQHLFNKIANNMIFACLINW